MPVARLSSRMAFPPVERAEPDGLLAVGGDLSLERLRLAYASGIFPWYSAGEPLQWWSPDPRYVLIPHNLHIPHSLKPLLNRRAFTITVNQAFDAVVAGCRSHRRKPDSDASTCAESDHTATWITDEMAAAYAELQQAGDALSVEAWRDGALCGGFYGVRIGRVFSGESAFSVVANAAKYALVEWIRTASTQGIHLIDCQLPSPLLRQLGAGFMERREYQSWLRRDAAP